MSDRMRRCSQDNLQKVLAGCMQEMGNIRQVPVQQIEIVLRVPGMHSAAVAEYLFGTGARCRSVPSYPTGAVVSRFLGPSSAISTISRYNLLLPLLLLTS